MCPDAGSSDFIGPTLPTRVCLSRGLRDALPPDTERVNCRGLRVALMTIRKSRRGEAAYAAVRPPSTGNAAPLMNEASSLAR
jgi:hypothetical protein